jgi:hypothetical protein
MPESFGPHHTGRCGWFSNSDIKKIIFDMPDVSGKSVYSKKI